MTALSRREQNKATRKTRVIDAALEVFAKKGFAAATMDAIAIRAGITKPTLYQYFPSKERLFQDVLLVPRVQMLRAFDEDQKGCHVAQLWQFSWAYADVVMDPKFMALARLVIGDAQRFPNLGRAYQEIGPDRVLRRLTAFMAQQAEAGTLEVQDPELAAEDFWGLILSAPRNSALHIPDLEFDRTTLKKYIDNGLNVFLRAYSKKPAADLARLDQIILKNDA